MGVTGLWKLIEQSGKAVPVDTLENKVLAVDISIWLHQVVKGFRDSNGATLPNAHLLGLFHRLCKLLYYRIKPVFVFDGGMPPLKRETIEKRTRNKNKLESEADRIQQLLLEALAKEKVVQQALGASASALLTSPAKSNTTPKKRAIEDEDLFKLPPAPEPIEDVNFDETSTRLSSDIDESDSSVEEKCYRTQYNINLQHIDVTSSHFQSLPADIRHEILTDIKELRKQSSWGRLHELPAESNSFSSFQMKRLLRRRRVQVELEGAEAEMGGKGLSLSELESLLSEKGIVDPDVAKNPIASNEHMRYVYVRDLKKAMEKSEQNEKEAKKVRPEKPDRIETIEENSEENSESMDYDLQRAIQLSLQTTEDGSNSVVNDDDDVEMNVSLRMTVEQQKALGTATSSLARGYMLEYGGLNDEQIKRMAQSNEADVSMEDGFKFKYNNDLFITTKPPEKPSTETLATFKQTVSQEDSNKPIEISEESSDEGVSSDADSDFIEVPDTEISVSEIPILRLDRPLPTPMELNRPPSPNVSRDFRLEDLKSKDKQTAIEIVVKTDELENDNDDIFADIFTASHAKSDKNNIIGNQAAPLQDLNRKIKVGSALRQEVIEEMNKKRTETKEKEVAGENIEVESTSQKSDEVIEIFSSGSVDFVESKEEGTKNDLSSKHNTAAMADILHDLNKEMSSITNLSLDSLLPADKENELKTESKTQVKVDDILKSIVTEKIIIDDDEKVKIDVEATEPKPLLAEIDLTTESSETEENVLKDTKSETVVSVKAQEAILESVFTPMPSTSQAVKVVDEKQTIEDAASILREKKTTEELEAMAKELNQGRRDLYSEMRKNERMASSITERMTLECMDLLRLFGVPYIVAPAEAEAQCAFLDFVNLTDGTITDDSDIWLFGGQTVYKNFFDQNKLVVEFKLSNIKNLFHLDRREMVQLSFLVGSDYTTGVNGIGSVTALEILSVFGSNQDKDNEAAVIKSTLSTLRKFRDWLQGNSPNAKGSGLRKKLKNITISQDFPNERVAEAYLYPQVDENRETFTWGGPDAESIREFAKKTFGWTTLKTDEILKPVLRRLDEKTLQQSIKNYFKIQSTPTTKTIKVSDRVRKALDKMSNEPNDEDVTVLEGEPSTSEQKRPNRKTSSKLVDSDVPEKKPKTRKQRKPAKRMEKKEKEAGQPIDLTDDNSASATPSTSHENNVKQIHLPDPKRPIPQREKDKEILEQNKLKAIEVLKKMRARKK